ncbi:MAG: hypothetical protein KDC05_01860 [Bacteroidales bacterium]|nr:hypothetical protein [Bacteroidales bacterium]
MRSEFFSKIRENKKQFYSELRKPPAVSPVFSDEQSSTTRTDQIKEQLLEHKRKWVPLINKHIRKLSNMASRIGLQSKLHTPGLKITIPGAIIEWNHNVLKRFKAKNEMFSKSVIYFILVFFGEEALLADIAGYRSGSVKQKVSAGMAVRLLSGISLTKVNGLKNTQGALKRSINSAMIRLLSEFETEKNGLNWFSNFKTALQRFSLTSSNSSSYESGLNRVRRM